MTQEVLKMVLKALNCAKVTASTPGNFLFLEEAITAIKEALAQPQQCIACEGNPSQENNPCAVCGKKAQPQQEPVAFEKTVCPFCTSEWVTAEQHDRNVDRVEQEPVSYCEIHYLPEPCAQCAKEHEGYNIPPQSSVSEHLKPVVWDGDCVLGHCGSPAGCEASNCCRADYTTPYVATPRPQRKPLTDEHIANIILHNHPSFFDVARAIEATHGIKE